MMIKDKHQKLPSYNHAISTLFFLTFLVLFASFGLAVLFYQEPFSFWEHAFSDLGCTVTRQGKPNLVPRAIYATGMLVEGVLMLQISRQFTGQLKFRNQIIKRDLALLGVVGAVISILPNDLYHTIHSIGSGILVGVMYFFTMIFHFEGRQQLPRWRVALDIALLQVAVFPYAVAFFANWESKQSFQKLCLIGIFYALLSIVSASEQGFKPGEFIRDLSQSQQQ
ncbi:MAG: hypothetical protein JW757_12970 [Anaerolineales bacterium]|nr:hypothetical protein [Anaerolineales bacterium]